MSTIRSMYLDYVKQGVPPKEAAKLVQAATGLNARTGKPLKQPQDNTKLYNAYNKGKGYLGQYGD
jgi:hypothetical protein